MKSPSYSLRLVRILKVLRKFKKKKQQHIAKSIGIDQSNFSRIESGEVQLTLDQLKSISEYLKISIPFIIYMAELDRAINVRKASVKHLSQKFKKLVAAPYKGFGITDANIENILIGLKESYVREN